MPHQEQSKQKEFAELLDSKFKIPNTNIRFGIDPLLGLIPGAGDWLGGLLSMYFLIQAAVMGGRATVLSRMFLIILMDILVGSIPVIGEIFDVYWKANEQNAEILEELERNPQKTVGESRLWIWVVVIQFIAIIIGLLLLLTWLVAELVGLLI